jgi:hypothetical protein
VSKIWAFIRQLVGNGNAAAIGIFAFIVILCLLLYRPSHAADVYVEGGSSFGTQGYGPVLGLDARVPVNPVSNDGLYVFAGTDLWGSVRFDGQTVPNNWEWHAGLETCRWRVCGRIGAVYLQREDAINGSHTDYNLGLSFQLADRWKLQVSHISDAGTTPVNIGRQAISIAYRLQ